MGCYIVQGHMLGEGNVRISVIADGASSSRCGTGLERHINLTVAASWSHRWLPLPVSRRGNYGAAATW